MLTSAPWSDDDTARADQIWKEYQPSHDVRDRAGQTAGIDPKSGRVWFGTSALDIVRQMEAGEGKRPLYFVTMGLDYYRRKA